MKPIPEDAELKNFLNINGTYVGLIRGLCDMVAKKKRLRNHESQGDEYISIKHVEFITKNAEKC